MKWSRQGEQAWIHEPRAGWDAIKEKPSFSRVAKLSLTTGRSNDSAVLHKSYSALGALRRPFENAFAAAHDRPVIEASVDENSISPIMTLSMLAFEFQRDTATLSLGMNRFPSLNWYTNEPGLAVFETSYVRGAVGAFVPNIGYDIVHDGIRNVASVPRSASSDAKAGTFAVQSGVLETVLESRLLKQRANAGRDAEALVEGTPAVFEAANLEAIAIKVLTGQDGLVQLTGLQVREEAKPYIENDLRSGHTVVVPERNVTLNSQKRIGWWRVHQGSGSTLGRMDSGRGQGLTEEEIAKRYIALMKHRRWLLGGSPIQLFMGTAMDMAGALFITAIFMGILWILAEYLIYSQGTQRRINQNTRKRQPG